MNNLFKALGLFLDGFRPYAVSILSKEAGDRWQVWYQEALLPAQRDTWNEGLRAGSTPENLIDYHNLKAFAIKYKDLLRPDFKHDVTKLPTWLEEIAGVRHKTAHFSDNITDDEITTVFINIKKIAKLLQMSELEEEIERLQKGTQTIVTSKKASEKSNTTPQAWFSVVRPHLDIREGRLDESVFAANLAEVALDSGPEVYKNPILFFQKTYFTIGLKNIARKVIKGLNGEEDAENRVISLQTGFGGGKTHTMISLFHIAKHGNKLKNQDELKDLIVYTGAPNFESANIAVFTNTTNDPAQGRQTKEGFLIKTIWGEIAYQLGGEEAYNMIRQNDETEICPAGTFKQVLQQCSPALILLDEIADYSVKASAKLVGASSLADQTISFMQELTEAVASVNNVMLIATLPASIQEVANSEQATNILSSLEKRLKRISTDTKPVNDDEIYEVIRRRLFDELGDATLRENAISEYIKFYTSLKSELPNHTQSLEYREKLRKSYPFHPELIDMFRVRWASNHDFQRTRGVLRLLANIISDLWKRHNNLKGNNWLIHSSDVNFQNVDALSSELQKLYGSGYDAVITADISSNTSNAFRIDSEKQEYGQFNLTQGITATLLLGSFGAEGANKGLSMAELKLAIMQPNTYNHNSVNAALDLLENNAHYLYYATIGLGGKRFWFHTKPNINILINQAKNEIENTAIETEIHDRIRRNITNSTGLFKVLFDPGDDMPEQHQQPALIILGINHSANPTNINGNTLPLIQKIATKRGNTERIYRNTLLFLLCSDLGVNALKSATRDYLSCLRIENDYSGQLEHEQKADIKRKKDEANKQVESNLVSAYSIVAKYRSIGEPERLLINEFKSDLKAQIQENIVKVLKSEEIILESIGLQLLINNNLIPKERESVKVKDIYEAFLRYDDKIMITGASAIKDALQRYCFNGSFSIAAGDGTTFSRYYYKEQVPAFDVKDESYYLVHSNDYLAALKPAVPTEPAIISLPSNNPSSNPTIPIPTTTAGVVNEPLPSSVSSFQELYIKGQVAIENYNNLFPSFIMPFLSTGHQVEVEISFKIKANPNQPFEENNPQYKNAKESAKQLGLDFEQS